MTQLEPCPDCRRHVRIDETACPFCARPLAFAPRARPVLPRAPIGRAALFAFGALAAPACGNDESRPDASAAADAPAAVDAARPDAAVVDADLEPDAEGVPIYGAAPTKPPQDPTTDSTDPTDPVDPIDPSATASG
jgi:hypothetical protein